MIQDPIAIAILLGSFALLILIRTPIAFALGFSSIFTALYSGLDLMIIAQRMVNGMESIPLIAIPFFILAGQIMSEGRIAERLVNLASLFVGRIRGGLAMINCVDSMFFGGISGSAVADVSSLGSVLIPPSHNMIIYSMASGGTSIGRLFLAGALPGVLLGLSLMVTSYIMAIKYNFPREDWPGWKKAVTIFIEGTLSVGVAILIMGGIISGMFTASESAAVAVVYAFILTFFVYRDIPLSRFMKILRDSVNTVAMVFLLISTSTAFAWMMTSMQVPQAVAGWMLSISENKYVILTMVNIFLLLVGMVMDMAPAIVICTPILLPIMKSIGVDPVHFGVILVFNLGMGLCTPPVGNALFVGCAVGKAKIEEVMPSLIICYIPMVIILFIITFFPEIAMLLPNWIMK
jgi:TRAP-type C4-dicarboxylate transport system permease large subunit